ncbi:MAG: prolipoprotein diacylglyceryl transferase [Oligoflexia bacterium]|nr:prolipoprotein diacylglyceryl transferase [Oligoflexia bacterium]
MIPYIHLYSDFKIDTYLFILGVAISITYILTKITLRLKEREILILFTGCGVCAWVFAKLLFAYVFYFKFGHNLLTHLNFWFSGGVVFYGALFGGVIFFIQYSIIMKKFDSAKAIYLLPPLCVGMAIGRLGCLFSGCCYGKVCNYFWCIRMHNFDRHPVQLYEIFLLLILAIIIVILIKKKFLNFIVLSTFFSGHALIRLLLENFRGDDTRGVWYYPFAFSYSLSTSQIIAICVITLNIVFCIFYVCLLYKNRKNAEVNT